MGEFPTRLSEQFNLARLRQAETPPTGLSSGSTHSSHAGSRQNVNHIVVKSLLMRIGYYDNVFAAGCQGNSLTGSGEDQGYTKSMR